ncbi:acetyl-CoA carboxylase, carboxyltransferase subunit beta [Oceanibacterium hippocampi]|uniref:Acetyl-coenzyme A carboxylase carboxyl transferase subunit beta n=1 Tax=Oceanibacterium hippocampi TaxID=745714 RepID=A0A1Y5RP95_9PROT|nr:acetyl-CoA carboxylase, carboxyltransferase subunit beta [Oceanibacterium hippocampi]SLN22291.1 Acetyl-coenzyme A carboxylase carboxyl transferase subunit beta [Oceanibacterium hippocampi]
MNWLTSTVLPRIRSLGQRRETPDNLWDKCPKCASMIYRRELEEHQFVCHHCGHHMRIGAKARFEALFDDAAYERVELPEVPADPLKFRDSKRYTDRLKEARAKTGESDAVLVAHGRMGGARAVIAVQDFAFMGGSMGIATGEALVVAAETAVKQQAPLIVFAAAGGARMQEGILSLMQMPRTTIAVSIVKEAGLPFIVVLTDPTTGGVTASYAMLGDVHIAEPGALIGFAGPRVIEQTIREQLPEGFQRAEYLLEHGMVDMVVHRQDLRDTLIRLIVLLTVPVTETVTTPAPKPAKQTEEKAIAPAPSGGNELDIPAPTAATRKAGDKTVAETGKADNAGAGATEGGSDADGKTDLRK